MPLPQPDRSELEAYLMQVGHALNLVCELPEWLEHAALAKHLRHAAAESFAMNCRVLVEFLWSTATYQTDIRATDYCGAGWLTSPQPKWMSATGDKQVAHMTRERLQDPLVAASYVERAAIRDELVTTASDFASSILDMQSSATMTDYVAHARILASWPPPPTAGEDPAPFVAAIAHLQGT